MPFLFHLIITIVVIKLYLNLFNDVVLFFVLGMQSIIRTFFLLSVETSPSLSPPPPKELVVNAFIWLSKQGHWQTAAAHVT